MGTKEKSSERHIGKRKVLPFVSLCSVLFVSNIMSGTASATTYTWGEFKQTTLKLHRI